MSKIQEINAVTAESITRNMTNLELDNFQTEIAFSNHIKEQEKTKQNAKVILLNKLGITEEEAKLLLS